MAFRRDGYSNSGLRRAQAEYNRTFGWIWRQPRTDPYLGLKQRLRKQYHDELFARLDDIIADDTGLFHGPRPSYPGAPGSAAYAQQWNAIAQRYEALEPVLRDAGLTHKAGLASKNAKRARGNAQRWLGGQYLKLWG